MLSSNSFYEKKLNIAWHNFFVIYPNEFLGLWRNTREEQKGPKVTVHNLREEIKYYTENKRR